MLDEVLPRFGEALRGQVMSLMETVERKVLESLFGSELPRMSGDETKAVQRALRDVEKRSRIGKLFEQHVHAPQQLAEPHKQQLTRHLPPWTDGDALMNGLLSEGGWGTGGANAFPADRQFGVLACEIVQEARSSGSSAAAAAAGAAAPVVLSEWLADGCGAAAAAAGAALSGMRFRVPATAAARVATWVTVVKSCCVEGVLNPMMRNGAASPDVVALLPLFVPMLLDDGLPECVLGASQGGEARPQDYREPARLIVLVALAREAEAVARLARVRERTDVVVCALPARCTLLQPSANEVALLWARQYLSPAVGTPLDFFVLPPNVAQMRLTRSAQANTRVASGDVALAYTQQLAIGLRSSAIERIERALSDSDGDGARVWSVIAKASSAAAPPGRSGKRAAPGAAAAAATAAVVRQSAGSGRGADGDGGKDGRRVAIGVTASGEYAPLERGEALVALVAHHFNTNRSLLALAHAVRRVLASPALDDDERALVRRVFAPLQALERVYCFRIQLSRYAFATMNKRELFERRMRPCAFMQPLLFNVTALARASFLVMSDCAPTPAPAPGAATEAPLQRSVRRLGHMAYTHGQVPIDTVLARFHQAAGVTRNQCGLQEDAESQWSAQQRAEQREEAASAATAGRAKKRARRAAAVAASSALNDGDETE